MLQHFMVYLESLSFTHSWSRQGTDQRVLVNTYIEIFSPKKTVFSPVRNTSQTFFDFYCLYSMQLFSADATIFKKKKKYFLSMKT